MVLGWGVGVGDLYFSLLKEVQGQWAWSQMGVHDVRVTVLDHPLVSGVQGEGGRGEHTSIWAPPVMLPWCYVGQRSAEKSSFPPLP